MRKKIFLYTDGACNQTSGGWAVVFFVEGLDQVEHRSGKCTKNITNNRMELLAVIRALAIAKKLNLKPVIFSDSAYIVNTINKKWYEHWIKTGKHYENKDLWDILIPLFIELGGNIFHISRNSNSYHSLADRLAKQEMRS